MTDRSYKLIKRVIYILFGCFDVLALLLMSYWFDGELINNSPYAKAIVIIILLFGCIWLIGFFGFLYSKVGGDFIKKYKQEKS